VSEPCKHERLDDLDLCHNASQWRVAWQAALVGHSDAITLGSAVIERLTAERDDGLATIERVRALLGDHDGALWAVRGVREADIRAALESSS